VDAVKHTFSSFRESWDKCISSIIGLFTLPGGTFSLFSFYNGEPLDYLAAIGESGYGKVYLVEGTTTKTTYAVKCCSKDCTNADDISIESTILKSFNSRFIVKYHAV